MLVAYTNVKPLIPLFMHLNLTEGGFSLKPMMNKYKLEKEKGKLNRLVEEALDNGNPLALNDTIITHSRKVDDLVVKAQREKKRHIKKQHNR